MELSEETLESITCGDEPGWSEVAGTRRITDQGRWMTMWEAVFAHAESGRYFEIAWDRPSTEQQEGSEGEPPTYCEVELKDVTVTKWVPVATA